MKTPIATDTSRVPLAARWLGGFGAIPFMTCALAVMVLDGGLQADAIVALLAYGAVILSFLGGIQWGLAIAANDGNLRRLGLSVVPALAAWASLLMPPSRGAIVMAAVFTWVLLVDIRACRIQQAPSWYPILRWPLTAVAVSTLLLGVTMR